MKVHNLVVTGSLQSGGENITSISSSVASTVTNVSSSVSASIGQLSSSMASSMTSLSSSLTSSIGSLSSSMMTSMNDLSSSIKGMMATTSSNVFVGNQTISGSVIPSVNSTYDLGSPTKNFRHLYLSSASLYIDGTKVLGSTTQELQITTDAGQSFKILEAGSDTITLQAADGNITLATSGGGDVILDPTTGVIALKGTTTIYAGNRVLSSDGNAIHFGNSVTMTGSLVVTGFIETQELRTTYISSSILYRSGSTKFGDELTDIHSFTGSLSVSGSISVPGSGLVSGSSQVLAGTTIHSGSFFNGISVVSGSAQVDVMSTTNIARLATTGSNVFTGALTGTTATFSGQVNVASPFTIKDTNPYIQWKNSSDTRLGYIQHATNLVMTADSGDIVLNTTSGTITLASTGAASFSNNLTVNGIYYVPNTSYFVSGTQGFRFNNSTDLSNNFIIYNNGNTYTRSYAGINTTDPSFYLDVRANVADSFYTIAQFENRDYTSGTRSFIRVRNWLNAGGSYSSYFGQGQDGKTYIIANNSARGGDVVIDGGNGNVGIADSSPSQKLTVAGSIKINQDAALRAGSGDNWIIGQDSGTNVIHIGSAAVANDIRFDSSTGTGLVIMKANGRFGVNTTDPATTFDVNGYMGLRSNNYFYFGHTTSNIGGWTTRMYANGSTHMFNANGFTFNNEGYGSSTWLTINSSGNATFSNNLTVNGASSTFNVNASSVITLTSAGTNASMIKAASGDELYLGGNDTWQMRLSGGNILMDNGGNLGIDISSPQQKLAVGGSIRANRSIYNWYQNGTNAWDGYSYLHLKTNMNAGGAGNIHYTMSLFYARLYSYSSAYIREGSIGFHNWSGSIYNIATTGNVWYNAYTSSDGFVVLSMSIGSGTYIGVSVDWHQAYGYPFQDKVVTNVSPSNSATGVY